MQAPSTSLRPPGSSVVNATGLGEPSPACRSPGLGAWRDRGRRETEPQGGQASAAVQGAAVCRAAAMQLPCRTNPAAPPGPRSRSGTDCPCAGLQGRAGISHTSAPRSQHEVWKEKPGVLTKQLFLQLQGLLPPAPALGIPAAAGSVCGASQVKNTSVE